MNASSWGRPRPTSTPWRARGGHGSRHPVNTKTRKSNSLPSKTWRLGERLLTSGWRSPASSSLGARPALWLRPTSPPPHPQSPPQHAPTPPRCALHLLWNAWRRELQRPPQALAPPPPPRLLARGRRLPPLGESSSPITLLLLFLVRRRVLRSRRGRESLLLALPELLTLLFPALLSPDPLLLLARRPLLLPPLRRARARARGVGESDRAVFTVTICRGRAKDQTSPARHR
jgi:hypothetical protein